MSMDRPLKSIPLLFVLALALVYGSCEDAQHTFLTYAVDIAPADSGVVRGLAIFRTLVTDSGPKPVYLRLPQDQADRLERIYAARPDSADTEFVARERFATLPDDIGNHGEIHRYDSALGRAWVYAERYRGNPDLLQGLEKNLAAADTATDVVLGWLGSHLAGQPRWSRVRSLIDGDLRRTFRNLALRTWRKTDYWEDLPFTWYEHPAIFVALFDLAPAESTRSEDEEADAWAIVPLGIARAREAIADSLGLNERDSALHFLSSLDLAYADLIQYLARTAGESEDQAKERWSRIGKLEVENVVAGAGYTANADSLEVRLAVPMGSVGVDTNGDWDEDVGTITWSSRVDSYGSRGGKDPLRCYASWAHPDSALQRRLFGDVILGDDKLTSYCIWFSTLEPEQQSEWNRMLTRLRPGRIERLKEFAFSRGSGAGREAMIPGRGLILNALP
jgi:hypothetical protein